MFLHNVHSGDDLRDVLSAENLNTVFRRINSLPSFGQRDSFNFVNPVVVPVYSDVRVYTTYIGSAFCLTNETLAIKNESYITEFQPPIKISVRPPNNSDTQYCILLEDLKELSFPSSSGGIGIGPEPSNGIYVAKAAIWGICLAHVNIISTSHRYAVYDNHFYLKSTDDSDSPFSLVSSPSNTGLSMMPVCFAHRLGTSRPKGEFDTLLYSESDNQGNDIWKLKCFNSLNPSSPYAGFVYFGNSPFAVPTSEFQLCTNLYVRLQYVLGENGASGSFNVGYVCNPSSAELNDPRSFFCRISDLSNITTTPKFSYQRDTGSISVTERWSS